MDQARQKAWETRRASYGPRGHSGSYARSARERRALDLIVQLCLEGTLSEGQCCKALDMDRVDFRALADAARSAHRDRSNVTDPGRTSEPLLNITGRGEE